VHAETATVEEVAAAVDAGADAILFPGASPSDLRDVLRTCAGRARVIVSGLAEFDRLAACAAAGADMVSVGGITDSAPAADIGFELHAQ
jgi:nicotinate-nucleotide pyrophosphorylase (carboxylating)